MSNGCLFGVTRANRWKEGEQNSMESYGMTQNDMKSHYNRGGGNQQGIPNYHKIQNIAERTIASGGRDTCLQGCTEMLLSTIVVLPVDQQPANGTCITSIYG